MSKQIEGKYQLATVTLSDEGYDTPEEVLKLITDEDSQYVVYTPIPRQQAYRFTMEQMFLYMGSAEELPDYDDPFWFSGQAAGTKYEQFEELFKQNLKELENGN